MTPAELEALMQWAAKRGALQVGDDAFDMRCVELASPPEGSPRVAVASFCTPDDAEAFAKIGHVLTALAEARAEVERLREALQDIADTSISNPRNIEGAADFMSDTARAALEGSK